LLSGRVKGNEHITTVMLMLIAIVLIVSIIDLHLHLSHLADALIQSDLQIGAFTL
jgi:hypothetical protein